MKEIAIDFAKLNQTYSFRSGIGHGGKFCSMLSVLQECSRQQAEKESLRFAEVLSRANQAISWQLVSINADASPEATGSHASLETPMDFTPSNQAGEKQRALFEETIDRLCAQAKHVIVKRGNAHALLRKEPVDCFNLVYIRDANLLEHLEQDAYLAFRLLQEGGFMLIDCAQLQPHPQPAASISSFLKSFAGPLTLTEDGLLMILQRI
jgi:hypothetical protein